jgi:malate dehydrogenase (oxaloacetate-decarboxylating)(NADP+)
LLEVLSIAVAKAAIESGVAKHQITDWEVYKSQLKSMIQ